MIWSCRATCATVSDTIGVESAGRYQCDRPFATVSPYPAAFNDGSTAFKSSPFGAAFAKDS